MFNYLIRYTDSESEGMTIIHTLNEICAEEANVLIIEQLEENDIQATGLMIDEFKEIKNPIDWIRAQLGRFGFFL